MSKHDANITEKLRRWLRGDANIHQEGELDRHAQKDPFLAEALEGYRSKIEGDHQDSLTRIQQKIAQRSRATSGFTTYWRVAAAVLLLIVAGAVLYQLEHKATPAFAEKRTSAPLENQAESRPPLAEVEVGALPEGEESVQSSEPANEITAAPARSPSRSDQPADPEADMVIQHNQTLDTQLSESDPVDEEMFEEEAENILAEANRDKESVQDIPPPGISYTPPPPAPDDTRKVESVQPSSAPPFITSEEKSKINSFSARERLADRSAADAASLLEQREAGKRIIYGKILDVMGEPIIGASVSLTDVKLTANTDVKGEFQILADSNAHVLQIDYVGYNSLQIDVPPGGNISERFTLDDESLSVNQLQIALDRRNITRTKRLEPLAYPTGGRAGFKKYVKENAARGLPKGRVRLRFKIGADGRPYNIRVERSNNPVLNSSAMYLLQTGPDWIIVQGIAPIDMQFTVRFR